MKRIFWYRSFALLTLCISMTGCNSIKLRVESAEKGVYSDSPYNYNVNAHSTFWNLSNISIQKEPKMIEIKPAEEKPARKFKVTDGTDFVGKSNNHSVTYHITYWDSFLSVITLGLYVPFRIEYSPSKQ